MRVGLSTVFCFLFILLTHTFFPLVVLMISSVIFSSHPCFVSVLPASPGSHVHFYLTNIYYKVVCCSQILFQLVSLSACVWAKPTRSLGRSLHVLATLFLSPCLFILLRFDVNTRRTLPHSLNHSPFTCPATALFQPTSS
jgi:hypothetical protein